MQLWMPNNRTWHEFDYPSAAFLAVDNLLARWRPQVMARRLLRSRTNDESTAVGGLLAAPRSL